MLAGGMNPSRGGADSRSERFGCVRTACARVRHDPAGCTSRDGASSPGSQPVSTTSGVAALSEPGRSLLLRWVIAIVAFPVRGTLGHLIGGGGAATTPPAPPAPP